MAEVRFQRSSFGLGGAISWIWQPINSDNHSAPKTVASK